MAELYIEPLQDYYTNLCVKHKLLNHNDDTNVVFIRFQSNQDLSAIRTNASEYFVIFDNLAGQAIGEAQSNQLQQRITLAFLKRAVTGDDAFQAIETAQQLAMNIMFDFYGRMMHDQDSDDCGPLRYLLSEQMSYDPIDGPVEEDHYGWLMTIPMNVTLPAYDANKWNP
jgi:hypothetical protein